MGGIIDKGNSTELTVEMVLGSAIRQSAPHLTVEQALQVASFVLNEQEQLQPFLALQAPDNPAAREHSDWGVKVTGPDGGEGLFRGPKQPGSSRNPQDVLTHVQILGLVTSPLLRGVLRAYGFKYQFVQAAGADKKIIVAH